MTNPLYDRLFAPLASRDSDLLLLADGSAISGRAFLSRVHRLANALVAAGLTPGDRLAVQVEKSPEALALYGACVAAGVVFLPLNTAYTAAELEYFITDSEAGAVICGPAAEKTVRGITSVPVLTLDAAGQGTLTDAADAAADSFSPVDRARDDLAALLYTSGTTGRSKGAMLSQWNLLSNTEVLVTEWRFTDADILLHSLPIFHTHGLFVASNVVLASGGTMVFLPRFDADTVIKWLPRVTSMMGVPTFYTRLLSDARFMKDLTANMRLFTSGSAPLLAETHREFEARTGHRILERYGMTETSMNTSNPYDGERRAGTVGFPLDGVEIEVRDPDTGNPMPAGEIGVLWVRGPNVFKGYWQMPEKTAEELREDGFFITGDLGLIDDRGYIHIVGRGKDLIISGGYNIYPKEIELFLDDLPGVLESAVIGAPHPDFGESVVAVLVPEAGATLDADAVLEAVSRDMAGFKRPRRVEIVDALPRNTMGKVQKAQLRETYADAFQPAKA